MAEQNMAEQGPIFIVGMNGSGTTMLADLLDNASELYVFPRETRMIPWLIRNVDRYGNLQKRANLATLLQAFCDLYAVRMVSRGDVPPVDAVREPSVYGVVDAVYRHLAAKEGKRRWVEKSPMNLQFMLPIAAEMPTAKFIHIYRDGRDVAQSNQRRWHKHPIWSIYRWVQTVRQGRKDGSTLGPTRYLEVSYEALTEEPEATMRRVSEFIGVPYGPELLRSSMPFVNTVYRNNIKEKSGTVVANSQKWKSHFSAAEVARLEEIGGRLLAELGYETANPAGEAVPSSLLRKYWRCADVVNQGILVLQRYGFKRSTPRSMMERFTEGVRYIAMQRH
ncbi:MAG: sulfotransferase [Caldilineaceae bacterium]|nr:sulfotransferase [Caldilineaceae bacterium]